MQARGERGNLAGNSEVTSVVGRKNKRARESEGSTEVTSASKGNKRARR